jgi:(2Fe-2S) ferredoxin
MSQSREPALSNLADPPPYYRLHVFVCTNVRPEDQPRRSCGRNGSLELRDYLKDRAKEAGLKGVRINNAGCLDRCDLGPVLVIYPEGVWYGFETREDIDEILDTHLVKGGRVERLMLRPEDRQRAPRSQVS